MPRYLMTYLGGDKPSSPEEGKRHFAKYKAWLASLEDAAVSPMNPLRGSVTVGPGGDIVERSTTGMSGYTIVRADSMEAAIGIAKACPFLEIGGSLEVSEMVDMP